MAVVFHIKFYASTRCELRALVVSSEEPPQRFGFIKINLGGKKLPKLRMFLCWSAEQKVVNIDREEKLGIMKEETARVIRDGFTAALDHCFGQVGLPVPP